MRLEPEAEALRRPVLVLELLVGSRAHLLLHLSAHWKEKVRSSCRGNPSSLQAADILNPTLCKGLGGSWQRSDSEAERTVFLRKKKGAVPFAVWCHQVAVVGSGLIQ